MCLISTSERGTVPSCVAGFVRWLFFCLWGCFDVDLIFVLWDRVSEKLQKIIQTGGDAAGHSSVEDATATLDLVRWWIVNEKPMRSSPGKSTTAGPKVEARGAK